jgi:hypothetical protein
MMLTINYLLHEEVINIAQHENSRNEMNDEMKGKQEKQYENCKYIFY